MKNVKTTHNRLFLPFFWQKYIVFSAETTFLQIFLKNMLSENGILLFNKLAFSLKDKKNAKAFFENQFVLIREIRGSKAQRISTFAF